MALCVVFDGDKRVMGAPLRGRGPPRSGLTSAPKLLSELSFILLGALLWVDSSMGLASACGPPALSCYSKGPGQRYRETGYRGPETGKQKGHYGLGECHCCHHSRSPQRHKEFVPQGGCHTGWENTGQHIMGFS